MLKTMRTSKKYFFLIILIVVSSCSTNTELSSLNTDGIQFIAIVPSLPRDTLEVYYNRTIDGEIYTKHIPSEEEEKVIRNKLPYYFTKNPQRIRSVIDDLKDGLPSLLSIVGSSYGVPTFMIEIHWSDRKRNIGIIPTDSIEKAFYQNRDKLDHVLLNKYLLKEKEKGLDLIQELNNNGFKWLIKNYNIRNYENERLFRYCLLINFSSRISHSETEKQVQTFLKDIKGSINKLEYETNNQFSNVGYPISVHLYLFSQDEMRFVNERAKENGYKTFYNSEALEIFIEEKQNITLQNVIEAYKLSIEN